MIMKTLFEPPQLAIDIAKARLEHHLEQETIVCSKDSWEQRKKAVELANQIKALLEDFPMAKELFMEFDDAASYQESLTQRDFYVSGFMDAIMLMKGVK